MCTGVFNINTINYTVKTNRPRQRNKTQQQQQQQQHNQKHM